MIHEKFNKLLSIVNQIQLNKEKIALPILSNRLKKAFASYPEDKTIGNMNYLIKKLADSQAFISHNDLLNLYNKYYTSDNRFPEVVSEFGLNINSNFNLPKFSSKEPLDKVDLLKYADQNLLTALSKGFDNQQIQKYSKTAADFAKISMAGKFDTWNLSPKNLNIECGDEKNIIIKADYDTHKGQTSILIPFEVSNNECKEPHVFIGCNGVNEFNYNNVINYVKSFAGNNKGLNSFAILKSLSESDKEDKIISNAELALIRLKSKENPQTPQSFQDLYIESQIKNKQPSLNKFDISKLADVEVKESYSFLDDKNIQAQILHGSKNISEASDIVKTKLAELNYKNCDIKIKSVKENLISFAVKLASNTSIAIPVRISNNRIHSPMVFLCAGKIMNLNKECLSEVENDNNKDLFLLAETSKVAKLNPGELINLIKNAINDKQYAVAEDCLNVLKNKHSKSYPEALSLYMSLIKTAGVNKEKADHKCSLQMQTKKSLKPICGHTGLTIDKVYMDKFGNCRPLHRRGSE